MSATLTTDRIGTTTWTIDPAHTLVEFSVKHLMITTVKGRFASVSGTVTLDETVPSRSSAVVVIDAASIDTREEKRDVHLRSADFFAVDQYPELRFVSKRVDGDPTSDRFTIVGDLTIKGITREVSLAASHGGRARDPWGGDRMGFTATGKIDRADFGLTWNAALETGGVLVGNEIKITIDAELVAAG